MNSENITMDQNTADHRSTSTIPPTLKILLETNIKHLTIAGRDLDNLPDEIGNILNLQTLDISYNNFEKLPQCLAKLEHLESLNASNNAFLQVPEVIIKSLSNLKCLNLSWNWVQEFNTPPASYTSLREVNMSNNLLVQIPIWMFHPKCLLEKINMKGNNFVIDLGSIEPGRLNHSIKYLDVGNCSVKKTDFFLPLASLEYLCLGNQKVKNKYNGLNTNFDLEPNHLIPLKKLICPLMDLSVLPKNIGDCINLTYLDLSRNSLHFLPSSFGKLKLLQVAIFSSNSLAGLPDTFLELKSLESLLLNDNKMEGLPTGFEALTSLKNLDLYDNNLSDWCGIENMSLEAFDLEMNFIPGDDCALENYEAKREKLRAMFKVWNRFGGQRTLPISESLSDDLCEDCESQGKPEEEQANWELQSESEEEQENWDDASSDTEEEANERFDPNNDFSNLWKKVTFSPVPEVRGKLTYVDMVVEGQFEDL